VLEIREIEGQAWCMDCSHRVSITRRGDACPLCGGFGMIVEQGDELLLKELEVI
jgi:hydrogenase nickel incorporation protein HypA/HybF